ncbi:MAG TPA: hypothetical protein VFG09_03070 [Thermodesulfovibrionales bacterium]|nr:hypothetical protein [Thermodesulfovibrionales bacterium]
MIFYHIIDEKLGVLSAHGNVEVAHILSVEFSSRICQSEDKRSASRILHPFIKGDEGDTGQARMSMQTGTM